MTLARRGDEGEQTSEWLARSAQTPHTRAAGIGTSAIGRSQPRATPPSLPSARAAGPMFRVSRLAAVAALLAMCAHVFPRGAHALGVTDDHPLVARQGAPDMALCDRADAGHRRATQRGDQMLKLGRLEVAEACYLGALRQKNDFPMALYGPARCTRAPRTTTASISPSPRTNRAGKLAAVSTPTSPSATFTSAASATTTPSPPTEGARGRPGDVMAWEALGRHHLATSGSTRERAYENL